MTGSLLPAFHRLGAEFLRKALDAALDVQNLLAARIERVAVRADLEVQLLLGGARLPRRAACAPRLDLVVLGVDAFLHTGLLPAIRNY